jgi:hypothetical protein
MEQIVSCQLVLTDQLGVEHRYDCPARETAEFLADAIGRTGATVTVVLPELATIR